MKMKILLMLLVILSGCSVTMKPDQDTVNALNTHTAILNAITGYIAGLQAQGVLPKPTPAPSPTVSK